MFIMSDLMIVVYCWTNVFNLNIYENLLINKFKKKNNDDSISKFLPSQMNMCFFAYS